MYIYYFQDAVETGSVSTHSFEKALLSITPSLLGASDWNMKVKPVCWKDIGGMDGIKKKLQLVCLTCILLICYHLHQ